MKPTARQKRIADAAVDHALGPLPKRVSQTRLREHRMAYVAALNAVRLADAERETERPATEVTPA